MQLTQAQIRKFQSLYLEHFSVELSEDEAREKGMQLLGIMKRVYKPITRKLTKKSLSDEEFEKLQ